MKRHRVRLRPKARAARRSTVGRAAGVAALAAAAALVLMLKPWERVSLPTVGWGPLGKFLAVESAVVQGVPPEAAHELEAALALVPGEPWGPFEAQRRAELLLERFAWLEQVSASRSWLRRSAFFMAVPRGAVAAVSGARRLGPGPAWLGEDGRLFSAPAGVVPAEGLPRLDLAGWPDGAELAPAARLIAAAAAPDALPANPSAFAYDAREKGWRVELEDGTRLVWGGPEWTPEKLVRLREVLADAGPRLGRGFTADLRYFEDGRILVRP
ncbi:MAG: hypothetical protein HYZ75_00685 [Elusimicrobia bacterium]|nr:hypothetical protein [Elusimicrobiota bacterium]